MQQEPASGQVELDALGLTHGDACSLSISAPLDPVMLGGQEYRPEPAAPETKVDVSRTSSGYALRLRFSVDLHGPCFRCLEPAVNRVTIDVREVDQPTDAAAVEIPGQRPGDQSVDDDDEVAANSDLESPYVDVGRLQLVDWARDALILALPAQILCQEECLGLCSYCGESLNGTDPAEHDHGQNLDPRWSKLRDLR